MRKLIAIGCCGLVLGGAFSVFGATTAASARAYATCDQQVEKAEQQAAKDYKKGKITKAQYDAAMQDIADHRQNWGC